MLVLLIFIALIIFFCYSFKLKLPKCPVCGTLRQFNISSCPECGYDSQPFREYQRTYPVVDNMVYYRATTDRFARLIFKAEGEVINFVIYITKVSPGDIVYLKLTSKSFIGSRTWFDFTCYVNGIPIDTFSKNLKSHNAEWVALERLVYYDS